MFAADGLIAVVDLRRVANQAAHSQWMWRDEKALNKSRIGRREGGHMGMAVKVKRRADRLTNAVVRMAIPVAILVLLGFGCHASWSPYQAGTRASVGRDDASGSTANQVVTGGSAPVFGDAMAAGWAKNSASGGEGPVHSSASVYADPIAIKSQPPSGAGGELNGFDGLWGSFPLWVQAFVIVLCPLVVLFAIVLLKQSGAKGKARPQHDSGGNGQR